MSLIRELIVKVEKEKEEERKADEQHFAEQQRKYEEMARRFSAVEDEMKKHSSSIQSQIQQLMAHKHSIEKALKETENLTGLPIPHEHHGAVIDLISKVIGVLNNPGIMDRPNTLLLEEVQNDIITTTQDFANDLKEGRTEFTQAEALYHGAKQLKKLDNPDGNKLKNLDDTFNTILEEES